MTLQCEWTKITPTMAIEYLSHAAPNRRMRRSRTDAYARDMENGKWLVTGQPILFTAAGELVDGQHRLQAVIESGNTTEFLVIRGVRPDAIEVLDSGISRTFADGLAIKGESQGVAATLGALVRRMALWDSGIRMANAGYGVNYLTHTELAQYLEAHPEARDWAKLATGSTAHPPQIPASIFAQCLMLFARIDAEQALDFCSAWRDGTGLRAGSSILMLRERVLAGRESGNITRAYDVEVKLALAIIAWNRRDETITKLQLPKGGLTNKNFPEPQ